MTSDKVGFRKCNFSVWNLSNESDSSHTHYVTQLFLALINANMFGVYCSSPLYLAVDLDEIIFAIFAPLALNHFT